MAMLNSSYIFKCIVIVISLGMMLGMGLHCVYPWIPMPMSLLFFSIRQPRHKAAYALVIIAVTYALNAISCTGQFYTELLISSSAILLACSVIALVPREATGSIKEAILYFAIIESICFVQNIFFQTGHYKIPNFPPVIAAFEEPFSISFLIICFVSMLVCFGLYFGCVSSLYRGVVGTRKVTFHDIVNLIILVMVPVGTIWIFHNSLTFDTNYDAFMALSILIGLSMGFSIKTLASRLLGWKEGS